MKKHVVLDRSCLHLNGIYGLLKNGGCQFALSNDTAICLFVQRARYTYLCYFYFR